MPFFESRFFFFRSLFFQSLFTFWIEKSRKNSNRSHPVIGPAKKEKWNDIFSFVDLRLQKKAIHLPGISNWIVRNQKAIEQQRKIFPDFVFRKKKHFRGIKPIMPTKPTRILLDQKKKNPVEPFPKKLLFLDFISFYSYFHGFLKKTDRSNSLFFFPSMDVFFFLLRTKHKGSSQKEWEKFLFGHKNVSLEFKSFFSKSSVREWENQHLVRKQKNIFCANFPRPVHYNAHIYPAFYTMRFFFDPKEATVPPCVNCPVLSECSPQGIFSPFQCFHFHFWLKM